MENSYDTSMNPVDLPYYTRTFLFHFLTLSTYSCYSPAPLTSIHLVQLHDRIYIFLECLRVCAPKFWKTRVANYILLIPFFIPIFLYWDQSIKFGRYKRQRSTFDTFIKIKSLTPSGLKFFLVVFYHFICCSFLTSV